MSADFTTGHLDPDRFTTPEEEAVLAAAGETPRPGARHIDPDLAALAAETPAGDDLDDLRAELATETSKTEVIPVEGRSRYAVEFKTDASSKELDKLRQTCRDKSFSDKLDGGKFNALLVATKSVAIIRDGKPLEIDGRVATFMEPGFLDLLKRDGDVGALKAATAVVRFYQGDGYVEGVAKRILELSGFGQEVAAGDPTV